MVKYIVNFTIYFSLFIALLYFIRFSNKSKAYRVFTIYLILISIIQLTSEYLFILKTGHTIFLFHYYFIGQYILLSIFYFILLKYKWILWILCLVLGVLLFQYTNNSSLYNRYNVIGAVITQMVLVIYSLIYMYKSIYAKGEFVLVNIGVFVYLLSSTLLFASGNLVFDFGFPESVSRMLNDLNAILYLLFQILIFMEWYRNYRLKTA